MKCGGTSIRTILNELPDSVDSKKSGVYKHTEVRYWPNPIYQTHVFTVVRNPWERFHSLYWDIKSRFRQMHETEIANGDYKRWYKQMADQVDNMDFSDWIMHGHYVHPAEYIYNEKPLNTLEKSMSYVIEGKDMEVFDLNDLSKMDEYLRDIGVPLKGPSQFIQTNRSRRPSDYRGAYTNEARDKVGQVCKEDIERWGYDF